MPHRVVYFELVKKIEKKEKGNILLNIFGRSFTAKFFTKNDSLFNVVVCCVAVVRGAKLFFRSGVVVCYYYCCCCACMNRTGISFLCSCVYTFDNRNCSVCVCVC